MTKTTTTATTAPAREEASDAGFASQLHEYICAGYQALYIPTSEEARVEHEMERVATDQLKMGIVTWDQFDGFTARGGATLPPEFADKNKWLDPVVALRQLTSDKWPKKCMFVFRDLDDMFAIAAVRRAIRSLCIRLRLVNESTCRPLVILSPKLDIHPKLRPVLTVLEFNLPDEDRLHLAFDYIRQSLQGKDPSRMQCSPELTDAIVANLLGMTRVEAENTLAKCIVRHRGFRPEVLQMIKDEKASIVRKSEVLTYIHEEVVASRDQIGGYDEFLQFIDRRALAYHRSARLCNLDYPKGVVLLGVPGTGKSMVALATGRMLNLPVYTLDVGAIFGSLVGESESRMRDALRQITAQQGCVLLIDEADKAWGGSHDSRGDSGVTQRVFGQLLSWLAAKQDRTFVIMTMNRTQGIPPEFLRKGRFDEVFFVDLPDANQRRQIFNIHLRKRSVNLDTMRMDDADWQEIIRRTENFVGSEIEAAVIESRFLAFQRNVNDESIPAADKSQPTFDDLITAVTAIKPLATLDAEGVTAIREFCQSRARNVCSPSMVTRTTPNRAVKL